MDSRNLASARLSAGEAILALGGAAVLAASILWTPSTLPDMPICVMQHRFGVPCGGCGLTRSFCAISHGQFAAAFDFNPFGYALYAIALAGIGWPVGKRILSSRGIRLPEARDLLFLAPVLVVAMSAFGVVRLVKLFR